MYVAYFDEVKAMPQHGRTHYLVGGLAVPMEKIGGLEQAVTALSEEVFGTTDLTVDSEFHASYCYFGKGNFKGRPPEERIEIIARLARLLGFKYQVQRVI